jgi:DNA-binding transcriptional MerR regulator
MAGGRTKISGPKRRRKAAPRARPAADERPLKIGEAARSLGVEAYVLRFWETQFPFLHPRHAPSSHRMYERKDLELFKLVKRLLHIEGYTIAGARKHIREVGLERLCNEVAANQSRNTSSKHSSATASRSPEVRDALAQIRSELKSLQKLLSD